MKVIPNSLQLVPVAFGIQKLRVTVHMTNDVACDDFEQLFKTAEMEQQVMNVTICAFNKLRKN